MSEPTRRPRILVCEDDFGSRKILSRILSSVGIVDTASNGREAVDAVAAGMAGEERYDIIALDLQMPEMGGHDALKEIRRREEELGHERATILITTANEETSSVMEAFREQCDGYLLKPIRRADLLGRLADLGHEV